MKISKWFWVALAFLIVIIIMAKCMHDKSGVTVIEKPVIVPSERLDNNVKKDQDSSNVVVKFVEGINEILQKENKELSVNLHSANEDIRLLEQQNIDLANQLDASDLTDSIKSTNEQLSAATAKTAELCNANIANLNSQLFGKDAIINQERKNYSKLKSNYDTCIDNQNKLDKYAGKLEKQVVAHNKIAAGIISNVYPVFGYGVAMDFIHKKGYVFSGSVLQMNSKTYVQTGAKFIISFRKK